MRSAALLIMSAILPPGAAAQNWLTSFKPHPRCFSVIGRTASPDLPPGSTRLLLRAAEMSNDAPIIGARFDIVPLGRVTATVGVRVAATLDSSRVARRDSLPPGWYTVRGLGLGYQPKTDTIRLSADSVTSLTVFLQTDLAGLRCRPPDFRRPGERACVTDPERGLDAELRSALRFAMPGGDSLPGLPRYRREEVALVTDEAICRRAGRAYGGPGSPPRKVIVIRLGGVGYLVFDPHEPLRAGEFQTTLIVDRRWRVLIGLDG
jgi:hypothetical protein